MKKKERKELQANLLVAINKVLQDNKTVPSNKTEKAVKKSVKQIAKKTDKKKSSVSIKSKEAGLNSDKIKPDTVAIVSPGKKKNK